MLFFYSHLVIQMSEQSNEQAVEQTQREPTIIFLFDMKNWYESISPLSKLDLFDIVPFVASQFQLDNHIKAYVLVLTKSKWDSLQHDLKKKFMLISRRIKEEMEGPMSSVQRETYEQADIFKLLMGETSTEEVAPIQGLTPIKEEEDTIDIQGL